MRRAAIAIVAACLIAALGWEWYSPRHAIERLADFEAQPAELASRYDRASVRAGFAAQAVPAAATYPPPVTQDVILDALSAPEAVRLLVAEPYGAWQFAAAEGLPEDIERLIDPDGPSPMPRILEETGSWSIDRHGFTAFTARPADRAGGHAYSFERSGLGWRLVHVKLSEPIR